VKLDGVAKDFHPHGITLFRGDKGEETLLVINHSRDGSQAVESFGLTYDNGAPKLTARSSVGGGLLISPMIWPRRRRPTISMSPTIM